MRVNKASNSNKVDILNHKIVEVVSPVDTALCDLSGPGPSLLGLHHPQQVAVTSYEHDGCSCHVSDIPAGIKKEGTKKGILPSL